MQVIGGLYTFLCFASSAESFHNSTVLSIGATNFAAPEHCFESSGSTQTTCQCDAPRQMSAGNC